MTAHGPGTLASLTPTQRDFARRNVGLAFKAANRLHRQFPGAVDRDELLSAGLEALCRCAKGFDPKKGVFSTYVYRAIFIEFLKLQGRRRHDLPAVSWELPVRRRQDSWANADRELRIVDCLAAPEADPDLSEKAMELLVAVESPLLTDRERQVLRLRFGLGDGRALALAEVGDHFGFSRERARQICRAALGKLARHIRHKFNGDRP